ncbi:thiamine pyrophosphate-dependent dehydrogenase E1 component subunit alpha [bacterium CPR1]|nr:thiamine pyrophosphate-dependent dehydrogenase E1 component subunit alpha [bacterium CPR1]
MTELELYRWMALNRAVEERLVSFYRQNKVVGGVYRSLGQEAISVGTAAALEPQDVVAPLIRNAGVFLMRGYRPRDLFMQYMAKAGSPTGGRDCNTHFGDVSKGVIAPISMLGAMIPVCAGIAWAGREQGKNLVAMTYIGDGGTSTGDFHEGMNLAAVWKLPLVVIGEHNQYAYSTPTREQMAITDLAERARAYGIQAETVDGNDVLVVLEAARRAVQHARSGQGPYFLECKTMRMRGHAEHDDARYVPPALFEEWRGKDPLDRLRQRLVERQAQLERIDQEVDREVEAEARLAEESPMPDPSFAFGRVFA